MKRNNIIIIALAIGFFLFGINAVKNSMPKEKNERIYNLLKPDFSYTIEKRFGGLQIHFKDTDEIFKPSNEEIFTKIEEIDRHWAKNHLRLSANTLQLLDDNNNTIKNIELLDDEEKNFIINYFGVNIK